MYAPPGTPSWCSSTDGRVISCGVQNWTSLLKRRKSNGEDCVFVHLCVYGFRMYVTGVCIFTSCYCVLFFVNTSCLTHHWVFHYAWQQLHRGHLCVFMFLIPKSVHPRLISLSYSLSPSGLWAFLYFYFWLTKLCHQYFLCFVSLCSINCFHIARYIDSFSLVG